ncbi:hypothetical protein GMA11_04320 [Granulicatella sp. zg-ZJ]|uniref:hypothetical protein n=1 Tax=Granulicatella sp. zg-ZJ TaxID=2678504 RepID=UPI0013D45465|nr:hypothetical protein [Granulicatella sp. zg-ZJ]NEW62614.1 hypothetical protein [Granulicatella sp. zg-ZJ]
MDTLEVLYLKYRREEEDIFFNMQLLKDKRICGRYEVIQEVLNILQPIIRERANTKDIAV